MNRLETKLKQRQKSKYVTLKCFHSYYGQENTKRDQNTNPVYNSPKPRGECKSEDPLGPLIT